MMRESILTAVLLIAANAAAQLPPELTKAVTSSESAAPAALLPRKYFLAQPEISLARLSPDEKLLAFIVKNGHESTLYQVALPDGNPRLRFRSRGLQNLHWSSDSQQLYLEMDTGLAVADTRDGRPHLLIRLDEEKEETFLGMSPNGNAAFISLPEKDRGFTVYRLEASGERKALLHTTQPVRELLADANGIRYFREVEGNRQIIFTLQDDAPGSHKRQLFQCDFLDACVLLGAHGNKLLLRSDGDDHFRRLLQLDVRSGILTELHRDPLGIASLDSVKMGRDGITPLITTYRSDTRHNYGLGDASKRVRALEHALSGYDLTIEAHTAYGIWTVRAERSDQRLPRYYLLRAGSEKPEPILDRFLDENILTGERQLSPKIPFSYKATDGQTIPAYVTLPRGLDLKQTPIIANPHGGPWNRVDSAPNGFSQFLANRGYIVFEPNFRASTGYSREFALGGMGEFGNGRVQQDILDGLDFLLAHGIGDAKRQAMVGHSFGGFSTLTGLVFTPERFAAGVATSAPTDFISTIRDYEQHFDQRTNGVRWSHSFKELVGDIHEQHFVEAMRTRMPSTYPEKLQSPLLMIAGGNDPRVDRRQIKGFVSQVQTSGGNVQFLLDKDEGHSFRAPLAREAYLHLTESFLAQYLGGEQQGNIPEELQYYLRQNMVTSGQAPEIRLPATPGVGNRDGAGKSH